MGPALVSTQQQVAPSLLQLLLRHQGLLGMVAVTASSTPWCCTASNQSSSRQQQVWGRCGRVPRRHPVGLLGSGPRRGRHLQQQQLRGQLMLLFR